MRGVPARSRDLLPGRSAHLARDARPANSRGHGHRGALRRGLPACGCGRADRSRRAAHSPAWPLARLLTPYHAIPRCARVFASELGPVLDGLARRRRASERLAHLDANYRQFTRKILDPQAIGTAEVCRAHWAWPLACPRRQARWVGRDLRRDAASPARPASRHTAPEAVGLCWYYLPRRGGDTILGPRLVHARSTSWATLNVGQVPSDCTSLRLKAEGRRFDPAPDHLTPGSLSCGDVIEVLLIKGRALTPVDLSAP